MITNTSPRNLPPSGAVRPKARYHSATIARQGRDELYNLRTDQNERVNVVAKNRQLALHLRQKLAARVHVDKVGRKTLEASCKKG